MKQVKRTRAILVTFLLGAATSAPSVWAVNYVVDGLNGDDINGGISATGGASDLAGLDFSDAFKTIGQGQIDLVAKAAPVMPTRSRNSLRPQVGK